MAPTNLFGAASFGGTTTTSQAASTPFATTGFGAPSTNLLASATSQPKESAPAPAAGLFGAPAAAAPVSNAGEIWLCTGYFIYLYLLQLIQVAASESFRGFLEKIWTNCNTSYLLFTKFMDFKKFSEKITIMVLPFCYVNVRCIKYVRSEIIEFLNVLS